MHFLKVYCGAALLIFIISACKKEGCTDPEASNYDPKANKENQSCVYPTANQSIVFPEHYSFAREGASSVDIADAVTIEQMRKEWLHRLGIPNVPGTAVSALELRQLLYNTDAPFSNNQLNKSELKMADFVAGGDPFYLLPITAAFDSISSISAMTITGLYTAAKGVAGVMAHESGGYLMNKQGMVYSLWLQTASLSAAHLHYINYTALSDKGMGGTDGKGIENAQLEKGKTYTLMEHNWDMAFGLFSTCVSNDPSCHTLWGRRAAERNAVTSSFDRLFNYFIRGRYAIAQKDMVNRNTVIIEIHHEMDRLCAASALYHLAEAARNIENDAFRNAALSSASGYIWGLQFCHEKPAGASQVNSWLDNLGRDFYEVNPEDIESLMGLLSERYDLMDERYKF
jgi:hypothetical protein